MHLLFLASECPPTPDGCDPSAAPIFQQYAPELLNLINADGPQYLWEHPTRWRT